MRFQNCWTRQSLKFLQLLGAQIMGFSHMTMWLQQHIFNQALLERSSSVYEMKFRVEQLLKENFVLCCHQNQGAADEKNKKWLSGHFLLGVALNWMMDGWPRSALAQNSCLSSKKPKNQPLLKNYQEKGKTETRTIQEQNKSRELNYIHTVEIKLTQISFQPSNKQPNPNPANPPKNPKTNQNSTIILPQDPFTGLVYSDEILYRIERAVLGCHNLISLPFNFFLVFVY